MARIEIGRVSVSVVTFARFAVTRASLYMSIENIESTKQASAEMFFCAAIACRHIFHKGFCKGRMVPDAEIFLSTLATQSKLISAYSC